MAKAHVRIVLDDGSDCYVTRFPVESFEAHTVAAATMQAAGWFITSFARDEGARGTTWDPVEWREQYEAKLLRMQNG